MLTKPGIILGNILTASAGFIIGRAPFNFSLFLAMVEGLAFIIGAACVFNNYIDRKSDAKMIRTRLRPLAQGMVPPQGALLFATFLGLMGTLILILYTNLLTTAIAFIGVFAYVILYSFLKYRTPHVILIGSIAGAVPPIVGYTAVTHAMDKGALILFLMMAFWQMPHFFAIAIYRINDYAAAGIPVFPLKKGMRATKIQMIFYVVAFTLSTTLLTFFHYTGNIFLIVSLLLGISWSLLTLKGFNCTNDFRWARQMFIFSLIVVNVLCFMIPFSL